MWGMIKIECHLYFNVILLKSPKMTCCGKAIWWNIPKGGTVVAAGGCEICGRLFLRMLPVNKSFTNQRSPLVFNISVEFV